ncbi:hypothetical protein [Acidaminobacter hydrogenoformans]|uniref:Uncharacterized protein n=1 Tax=Acidaminobacter hydrogenoformans DSM 2784 TaxID=1120920 RepID=A0A1G5S6K5_9FIRM|nr:hypothetical protein [Acidaminobacter hydrogenoformans]SCZ81994.1 hypothetical protein SAMN03080599_03248 [Acidaminobacter hydrogenoformans DSM 2784]
MHEGFNRIFWGMIFVTFHITIGGFEVLPLPSFVGFLMVRGGILEILRDPKTAQAQEVGQEAEAFDPNLVSSRRSKDAQHYLKRASLIALISAIAAVPRVAAVQFNDFLSGWPLASLFKLELNSILDLALAYYVLSGAVCLLRAQGDSVREAFYLKRLKTYLILLVTASVLGTILMALGVISGWTVVLGMVVLALRIWLIAMLHGLKPKTTMGKVLKTELGDTELENSPQS